MTQLSQSHSDPLISLLMMYHEPKVLIVPYTGKKKETRDDKDNIGGSSGSIVIGIVHWPVGGLDDSLR